jgi:adenosylhomocysteine nucleosidase
VDADRVAACATSAEERAARRAGFSTARIGLGARRGVPAGELVSFGVAGGLDGLEVGTVIDATRVVDEEGRVLWEGEGLGLAGGRPGTILAARRVIDDPAERRRLHELTGADAVDLESGVLAASGRLRGCVRAISDTPERTLGALAAAVDADGRPRPLGFLRALARRPAATLRALVDIRTALAALGRSPTRGRLASEGRETA